MLPQRPPSPPSASGAADRARKLRPTPPPRRRAKTARSRDEKTAGGAARNDLRSGVPERAHPTTNSRTSIARGIDAAGRCVGRDASVAATIIAILPFLRQG